MRRGEIVMCAFYCNIFNRQKKKGPLFRISIYCIIFVLARGEYFEEPPFLPDTRSRCTFLSRTPEHGGRLYTAPRSVKSRYPQDLRNWRISVYLSAGERSNGFKHRDRRVRAQLRFAMLPTRVSAFFFFFFFFFNNNNNKVQHAHHGPKNCQQGRIRPRHFHPIFSRDADPRPVSDPPSYSHPVPFLM